VLEIGKSKMGIELFYAVRCVLNLKSNEYEYKKHKRMESR